MDSATYPTGDYPPVVTDAPQPDTWRKVATHERREIPQVPYSLDAGYRAITEELFDIWRDRLYTNRIRYRYYDGKNKLKDFGISTPPELLHVETVVDWPNKAVSALADRVRFDGFTAASEDVQTLLDGVSERSRLNVKTRQATHGECIFGPAFATVGVDDAGRARIDFHSAEAASAVWDDAKGRIAYGMVIDAFDNGAPSFVRVFTDEAQITLVKNGDSFDWYVLPIAMGRVPMEVFTYRPTDRKPFGQSRISRAVMSITDDAVRCALGGSIAFQFAVSPQKWMLGVDRDPFEQKTRWEAYIGNWIAIGYNGKDGVMPQVGQMQQPSMQQYSDYMRSLAARFSGATNVPVSQLGVIHDNPASAEAIYAANEPLIIEATDVIEGSRDTMRELARMCIAAERDASYDELTDEERAVMANYRNPALPSVVSMADAAVKIAGAVDGFAGTSYFWKMIGLPEDARREIEQTQQAAAASAVLTSLFGADNGE